MFFVRRIS